MRILGLLLVLFGGFMLYLLGWQCYSMDDFQIELADWLHVPIGGHKPGEALSRPAGSRCLDLSQQAKAST